jgi:hypothetical protein
MVVVLMIAVVVVVVVVVAAATSQEGGGAKGPGGYRSYGAVGAGVTSKGLHKVGGRGVRVLIQGLQPSHLNAAERSGFTQVCRMSCVFVGVGAEVKVVI